MNRTISLILPLFLFTLSCSDNDGKNGGEKPEKEDLLTKIEALEDTVDEMSKKGKFSDRKMRDLMDAYKGFVEHYPDDSLAPEHLFRAGGVARSLDEPQRAINIYRRILNEYPETDQEPTVRFLLAFVYDQDLNKKNKAKELYQAVIDSFPDHKLARDAEQYLKVIDMSDEELMKHFEEQQKKREEEKES